MLLLRRLAVGTVMVAAAVVIGLPVSAESGAPQVTVSPGSVVPGESVTVSGTGCPLDASWDGEGWQVHLMAIGNSPLVGPGSVRAPDAESETQTPIATPAIWTWGNGDSTPDSAGRWSTTITLAADAPLGELYVIASCYIEFAEQGMVAYPAAPIQVVAPTTTTAPPTPLPPASPERRQPAFTG